MTQRRTGRARARRGDSPRGRLLPALLLALAGCGGGSGPDTPRLPALKSLETARTRAAAGDYAGTRDACAAATAAGGLQPDFYCEALFLQADCESRLGNQARALALLEQLAPGAPDVDQVNNLREAVLARQIEAARGSEAR